VKRLLIPLTATALSAAALTAPASAAAPSWASDPLAAKPADGYSSAYFWLSSNGAALSKATQYHWDAKAVNKVVVAKASDQPDDGKPGSTAPATNAPAGTKVKNVNLPRTIGKVFFIDNKGEHHWCSATSIQSRHRNLVATAGHCVFENGKDDVYDKWVFVPGYYQGKAPWGIYAGAYAFTAYDLDTYDDYDGDFAFVAVHNGFQFAGTKEVSKADYDKWTGDKWVKAREISRADFVKCRLDLGKCWSQARTASELAGPDFPGAVVERVEVSDTTYKAAKVGKGQGYKFGEPTVENVTKPQWDAYKGLGVKSEDKAGNYLITHYYTQKWVKPGTARKYYTAAYTIGVGKDMGPLGDAVGGQGVAWNQPLGQQVTVFGYPGEKHPDGHKAFTGVTPKWCYGKTGTKTYQANTFRVETHQVLKCSMTGGSDGGPWILRYSNSKRTGYLNGVTSMFHDQDGNDRVDTISSPYFDGEVADVYNKANYAETKPVVGPNGELLK
jgi:V8-like Glu-specific endopeptidase